MLISFHSYSLLRFSISCCVSFNNPSLNVYSYVLKFLAIRAWFDNLKLYTPDIFIFFFTFFFSFLNWICFWSLEETFLDLSLPLIFSGVTAKETKIEKQCSTFNSPLPKSHGIWVFFLLIPEKYTLRYKSMKKNR